MRAESDNSVQKNDQANDQPEGREGRKETQTPKSSGDMDIKPYKTYSMIQHGVYIYIYYIRIFMVDLW